VLPGALASLAACASIAGIDGLDVDSCFNGCDEAGNPIPTNEGGPQGDAPNVQPDGDKPEGSSPDAEDPDANLDAGPCPCPATTKLINGSCVVNKPATNVTCTAPVQLPPNCPMKLIATVCDTDPPFAFPAECNGDGGVAGSRPTAFFRLGTYPPGTYKIVAYGAFNLSTVNGACDQGAMPCTGGGFANSNFSLSANDGSTGLNNLVVAVGKRSETSPCHEITIEVGPQ
jgi:hypothetical protein